MRSRGGKLKYWLSSSVKTFSRGQQTRSTKAFCNPFHLLGNISPQRSLFFWSAPRTRCWPHMRIRGGSLPVICDHQLYRSINGELTRDFPCLTDYWLVGCRFATFVECFFFFYFVTEIDQVFSQNYCFLWWQVKVWVRHCPKGKLGRSVSLSSFALPNFWILCFIPRKKSKRKRFSRPTQFQFSGRFSHSKNLK